MTSCIQKLMKKIAEIQKAEFENLVIWSDDCATQLRSKFVIYIIS